jgi:hypothetical protein
MVSWVIIWREDGLNFGKIFSTFKHLKKKVFVILLFCKQAVSGHMYVFLEGSFSK